jgi:type III restriction enzyme
MHLSFEITCSFCSIVRKFRPDYLVRLDNGKALIREVKEQDNQEQQTKLELLAEWFQPLTITAGSVHG